MENPYLPEVDLRLVRREMITNARSCVLRIYGMHCSICAIRIQNKLQSEAGVILTYVNDQLGMAEVEFDGDITSPTRIAKIVALAGDHSEYDFYARVLYS